MLALGVVNTTARLGHTRSIPVTNLPATSGSSRRCDITKDDCDGAWDSREQTFAGALDITPPDTDRDGKPDLCVAVTRDGCAHCYEYSIAEAAAQPGCLFRGRKTFSNSGDVDFWETVASDPPSGGGLLKPKVTVVHGLKSIRLPVGEQSITLAPGITATQECTYTGGHSDGNYEYVGLFSSRGKIGFKWRDSHAEGSDARVTCEYTFSGGRFFSSRWGFKARPPAPPRKEYESWTAMRWEGTLLTLTHCFLSNCTNQSWALADDSDITWR